MKEPSKTMRQASIGIFGLTEDIRPSNPLLCECEHPVFEVELPKVEGYGHGKMLAMWSGKSNGFDTPPAPGDVVRLSINSIGEGTVKGYFIESGYLGVIVTPHNPPEWWKKSAAEGGFKDCTVFGSEIRPIKKESV